MQLQSQSKKNFREEKEEKNVKLKKENKMGAQRPKMDTFVHYPFLFTARVFLEGKFREILFCCVFLLQLPFSYLAFFSFLIPQET